MESNSYMIFHSLDDGKHDFNIRQIPTDLILGLINTLRMELPIRIAADCAPSFREERASQHERHLLHSAKNGTIPIQQFIDFPLK